MIDLYKKILPIAASILLLVSCDIREESGNCGDYLRFVFDRNMEFEDLFSPLVGGVDVYIFDSEGKYFLHRHSESESLIDGNLMLLDEGLEPGRYSVLTVGGLADPFGFTDTGGGTLTVGQTSVEDVMLWLRRTGDTFSDEFSTLWFSDLLTMQYRGNGTVWTVNLVRNTNIFNITLAGNDDFERDGETDSPYTFEIVTPEGAAYGYDNRPLLTDQTLTFEPYHLVAGTEGRTVSIGVINTMRLLHNLEGYRLIVRDVPTGIEMWSYDLMALLEASKPASRPDGTPLSIQEYLDRQGVWDITLNVDLPDTTVGFAALSVIVNGWILWLHDIGIE